MRHIVLSFIAVFSALSSTTAQTVNANSATIHFEGLTTRGSQVSIMPNCGGRFWLSGTGESSMEFCADVAELEPMQTTLELLSNDIVVRTLHGPCPTDMDIHNVIIEAVPLDAEDWIWPAVAIVAFVASCIEATTTTEVIVQNGQYTTTTTTTFGWDCPGIMDPGQQVTIDGASYEGITGLRLKTVSAMGLPEVTTLRLAAQGGARITSIR